jgi:1-acyl-sn-glycerol-3-phosphate acyltransferase
MSPRPLTWRWRLLAVIVIASVRLVRWRVQVEGLEHVPRRGGAVLAFNHHSYVDFVLLGWPVVRSLGRPVRFLAKREIWDGRISGWAARWADAVPVERTSAGGRTQAFSAAAQALRDGDLVAVAPEQTISTSLELLPFRTGAVRLAQRSGAPIVPVIGWGSHRCVTKGRRPRLRFGLPVVVHFGAPLTVAPDEDPLVATAELRRRMEGLLHEVQEGYVDGAPAGADWVPARLGGSAPDHDQVLREHEARIRGWEREDGTGG